MSEHNDFKRRPEATTFEACFESIRESDYYVLIIGRNRGTWYDESNRTSVTQQEYRVAYDSAVRTGKPRLVMCVRSDVLTILRERRKMGSRSVVRQLIGILAPQDDSQLEDWRFTRAFLRDARREQTVHEVASGPNWVTPFANFRELVTALKGSMRIRGPLPKVALLENLRHELQANLRETMSDLRGRPFYQYSWLNRVRRDLEISGEDLKDQGKAISVTFEHIRDLNIYINTCLPHPDVFLRGSIDEAIVSGAFLDYDRNEDRYLASPLLTALRQFREELDRYRTRRDWIQRTVQADLAARWEAVKDQKMGTVVPAMSLFAVYGLHDSHQNVIRFLVAILRHLYGHTKDIDVMRRPISPVPRFAEEIKAERVSDEQLRAWLEQDDLLLSLGMVDLTPEQRSDYEAVERVVRRFLGDEAYEKLEKDAIDHLMREAQYEETEERGEGEGEDSSEP